MTTLTAEQIKTVEAYIKRVWKSEIKYVTSNDKTVKFTSRTWNEYILTCYKNGNFSLSRQVPGSSKERIANGSSIEELIA